MNEYFKNEDYFLSQTEGKIKTTEEKYNVVEAIDKFRNEIEASHFYSKSNSYSKKIGHVYK